MRLKIRVDWQNPMHSSLAVFINGQNCGKLCIGTDEVETLLSMLSQGCVRMQHMFEVEGWDPPTPLPAPPVNSGTTGQGA